MNVIWGSNQLNDCVALLSWKDEVVLSVTAGPLKIDLKTPLDSTSRVKMRIEQNRIVESTLDDVRVLERPDVVTIVVNGSPLLMAHDLGDGSIVLHTDLRSIGMNIFDDVAGLHIGASTLAKNRFAGLSSAISLG